MTGTELTRGLHLLALRAAPRRGTVVDAHRAAAGTDLAQLDALGMRVAIAYEMRRLRRDGALDVEFLDAKGNSTASDTLVVAVDTAEAIRVAEERSPIVKELLRGLEGLGISRIYPGFDILTIRNGAADRLIELKSSGVDARVQTMTWNEWKTARHSDVRSRFWLYLVGNLRADLVHATPYVRAVNDPFGTLASMEVHEQLVRNAVQLRVQEFKTAEHLDLGVLSRREAEAWLADG